MKFIFIFPNLSFIRLILILSHKSTLSDINPGSLSISSPLAFAEGLFIFVNYFSEKEGFLIKM
jgi:hypothetical protein